MHDIEPHYKWRLHYQAEHDKFSPMYGQTYSEFEFTHKVYNYYIHPQWDTMGSLTLYLKLLFCDYQKQFAIIELIGEWNDCISNDIMYLKREIIDRMLVHGIKYYIIICDHVFNYHSDDDCYYEEWYGDVSGDDGWICLINIRDHVRDEMNKIKLYYYIHFGEQYNNIVWQTLKPGTLFQQINNQILTLA